jgi:hypothetical protein
MGRHTSGAPRPAPGIWPYDNPFPFDFQSFFSFPSLPTGAAEINDRTVDGLKIGIFKRRGLSFFGRF